MYKCGRQITHKCRWNPNTKLIVIAHDYSQFSPMSALTSALNDVSMIWKYFRRKRCLHEDQIFIYGNMNIDGKIVPWKRRFNIEIPIVSDSDIMYFYYSGHGYPCGTLDVPSKIRSISFKYYILDCCYSHKNTDCKTLLGATDENKSLACSNHKVSKFTLDLLKYWIHMEESGIKVNDFIVWMNENNYIFRYESLETFSTETFM